jgi:hypothetical protein
MKKLTLSLIGMLSMLLSGGSAYAQAVHIRVTIPFEFNVNNKALPAGQYEVLSAGPSNASFLEIRRADGAVQAYVNPEREVSNSSHGTKLVFQQYGSTYFLSQLWTSGSASGWAIPKAPAEIREARNSAGQQVTLAAR